MFHREYTFAGTRRDGLLPISRRDWVHPMGYRSAMTFEEIVQLTVSRKQEMPAGSSTAALFEGGPHAIGKKLVEEAAESWMAARFESEDALAAELGQVLYYVACMMAEKGIALDDVYRNL